MPTASHIYIVVVRNLFKLGNKNPRKKVSVLVSFKKKPRGNNSNVPASMVKCNIYIQTVKVDPAVKIVRLLFILYCGGSATTLY